MHLKGLAMQRSDTIDVERFLNTDAGVKTIASLCTEGESFGDWRVTAFLVKVGEAVAVLHALGYVHRDIKPANIMYRRKNDGGVEPVLIDLGLLKRRTESENINADLSVTLVDGKAVGAGTPRYAAPEQFNGGEVSPAADIHALGVLANECFGGRPSFVWRNIIRRAASSIAAMRYQSVSEFIKAVRRRHLMRNLCFVGILTAAVLPVLFLLDTKPILEGVDKPVPGVQNHEAGPNPFGEALGAPQYIWQTSEDMPWYVKKAPEYEGGAAVLASGGGGGVVETYLKTVFRRRTAILAKSRSVKGWIYRINTGDADFRVTCAVMICLD